MVPGPSRPVGLRWSRRRARTAPPTACAQGVKSLQEYIAGRGGARDSGLAARGSGLRVKRKVVWRPENLAACMDVVEQTYLLARRFPDYERFGLSSQMQRASVSMPSNVAEGWARGSTKVYTN